MRTFNKKSALKKSVSFLVVICMMLGVMPSLAFLTAYAEETPSEVIGDAWDGSVDTSWYNDYDTEFIIYTAEELAGLAYLVNNGNTFSGKTISLGNDIDLAGREWTPIGKGTGSSNYSINSWYFAGTFNGDYHTVNNVSITQNDTSFSGLFGAIKDATIECLSVRNVSINQVISYRNKCGGIAGIAEKSIIRLCSTDVELRGYATNNPASFGGILGISIDEVEIENCFSTVDIAGGGHCGGLVGGVYGTGLNIVNCYVTGTIVENGVGYNSSVKVAGGINGYGGTDVYISNSFFSGSVQSSGASYSYSEHGSTSNCYHSNNTSVSNFQTQAWIETNLGWDFDTVWAFGSASDYPILQGFGDGEYPPHEHDFVLQSTTPADCTTDGADIYVCSICNRTRTAVISALGHDYVLQSTTSADCVNNGVEIYACSRCNEIYENVVEWAYGHYYENGYCTNCGEHIFANAIVIESGESAYVEIVEIDGCVYFQFVPTANGNYYFYSTDNYSDPYAVLLDANGNELVSNDDGGNGVNFGIYYDCEANTTYYVRARMLGSRTGSYTFHVQTIQIYCDHDYVIESTTAADCYNDGIATYVCSKCNDSYNEVVEYALGHDYVIESTTSADCVNNGVEIYACSRCNESYENVTEYAYGHSYENGFCTVCGESVIPVYTDIVTDSTAEVYIAQSGGAVYFKFVPAVSGRYRFYSSNNASDTYGALLNANGEYMYYDDDGGDGNNFSITYECIADTTYYIRAYFYSNSSTGTYTLNVETIELYCDHDYVVESTTAADCRNDGIATYVCSLCSDSYTEVVESALGHTYVDGICSRCGAVRGGNALLVEDSLPWGNNTNSIVLQNLVDSGILEGFDKCSSYDLYSGTVDMNEYRLVVFASCQDQYFYNNIPVDAVLEYVECGGSLFLGGDTGNGRFSTFPFGIVSTRVSDHYNYIVDNTHPMITGIYSDNRVLQNSDMTGSSISHNYFTNYPENTNVILTDTNGYATLFEFAYGDGLVVVSGLTFEYAYVADWTFANGYDDILAHLHNNNGGNFHSHVFTETSRTDATCTEEGLVVSICEECGREREEIIPALGHDYVLQSTVEVGCETDGVNVYACSRCGESYEEVYQSAHGHSYENMYCVYCEKYLFADATAVVPGDSIYVDTDGQVYFSFTPIASGEYRFYSTNYSGDPYAELYDANGSPLMGDHDGGDNWNFSITYICEANTTYYICASNYDGYYTFNVETIEIYCDHDYVLQSTTSADCVNNGVEVYACSRCNESYENVIEYAYGHYYENGFCTRCGAEEPEFDTWDGTVDTSWYNDNDTEFIIYTAEELAGFAFLVNSGYSFSGKTVQLGNDINLVGIEWTPIGIGSSYDNYNTAFKGTFDGNFHTISGLYITNTTSRNVGLFGSAQNATVENISVVEAIIDVTHTNSASVGILIGTMNATTIANVLVSGVVDVEVLNSGICSVALAVGYVHNGGYSSVSNAVAIGEVSGYCSGFNSYVGGLVGVKNYDNGALTIENCLVNGIIRSSDYNEHSYAGGILGISCGAESIQNCIFIGEIYSDNTRDAIADYFNSSINYSNCYYNADFASTRGTYTSLSDIQSQSWIENNLGWDFESVWEMGENHPELKGFGHGGNDPHEHNYVLQSTVPAGCITEGSEIYTCSICGRTRTEAIPALGHDYVLQSTTSADCVNNGVEIYSCSRCEDTYENIIEYAYGHYYENGFCTRCGESVIPVYIDAVPGSSYSVEIVEMNDEVYFKFVPVYSGRYCFYTTDHSGDPYGELFDANGNSIIGNDDGGSGLNFSISYDCEANTTYYIKARMLGSGTGYYTFHVETLEIYCDHEYVLQSATVADCYNDGIATYVCSKCNDRYEEVVEYALGHDYVIESTTSADCVNNGVEIYVCSRCNESYENVIEYAYGHSYENGFCTVCGEHIIPEYVDIETNSSYYINIAQSYVSVYFKFVPTASGRYRFYSTNYSGDPYVELLDENGNYLAGNDDGGEDWNFSISYDFTANTVYYIRALMNGSTTGSYTFNLETIEIFCDHDYVLESTTAADCYNDGIATYVCPKCNDSYEEVVEYALGHDYVLQSATEADCYNDSIGTYACTRCNDSYTDVVASKLAHDYVDGECTRCGAEEPEQDVWDGTVDTSWYNDYDSEFVIYTAEELAGLAYLVNNGNAFRGKTVQLGNNIDLADLEWTPIGNGTSLQTYKAFSGSFNGNGYIINNLRITESYAVVGLFGCTANATVCNVGLENVWINTGYSNGTLAVGALIGGQNGGTTSGCYMTGSVNATNNDQLPLGGLIGIAYSGSVRDCYAISTIISTNTSHYAQAGGLIGTTGWHHNETITIDNCFAISNISATTQGGVSGGVGGLIGDNYATSCTVRNCFVLNSTITVSTSHQGAIYGYRNDGTLVLDHCYYANVNLSDIYGGNLTDESNLISAAWLQTNLGWDFDTVWEMGESYPILKGFGTVGGDLPHTHSFAETSRTEPTCTTDGSINYVCSCGATRIEIISALGHNIESIVESQVTCVSDGLIVDRCTNNGCDYEKRTVIHGEHNYSITDRQEATCNTSGYIEYTCSNCNDKQYEYFDGKHNYVETSRVEAQVEVEGSITYTCTYCYDSYSIVIPALTPVLKNSSVLLIQDSLPWAEDVNTALLEALKERGVVSSYNIISTRALDYYDLSQYGVVFIANDQSSDTYARLAANAEKLENYVRAGGNLIYGACDSGWGGCGSLTHTLPGGVVKSNYYSVYNYIVNDLHPIVTGVYTDNRSLRDELLKGNYCSHTYFEVDTLPEGTDIILRDANGNPTLIEYTLGEGTVIASGLTWEYFYVRDHYDMVTNYSKYAYDDLVTYMVYISSTCEHEYELVESVEATCEENGYTKYVCVLCAYEYKSDIVIAPGHSYVESSHIEPTCTTEGSVTYICECGDTYVEIFEALGHKHVEDSRVEPTCTAEGSITYVCVCGDTYVEVIAMIDHEYVETSRTEGTCTVMGEIVYTCHCGDVKVEKTGYADHVSSDWIVDSEATAIQTGMRHKECTVCQTILETEIIPVSPKIVISDVEAEAGSIVKVTIDIKNNPGILGAALTLNYDPALTLINAEAGIAWSSLTLTKPSIFTNSCNFVWDGITADYGDGTIIVLTFMLPEDADMGMVYNISASYTYGNMINADLKAVDIEIENGSITVADLLGDVNDDGIVNVADVITLRRYIAGGYEVEIDEIAADMDSDGDITVADIVLLRRFLVR